MKHFYLNYKKGMTLIEVIMAIAILGIISITFLPAITNSFKMLVNTKHFTEDTFAAQKVVEDKIEKVRTEISQTPTNITEPNPFEMRLFGKIIKGHRIIHDIESEDGNKHGEINVFVTNEKIKYDVPVVSIVEVDVWNGSTNIIPNLTEIDISDNTKVLKGKHEMSTDIKSTESFLMNIYKWYVSFENITDPDNKENYSIIKEWNEARVKSAYDINDYYHIPNIELKYNEFKINELIDLYAESEREEKRIEMFADRYIRYSVTPYSKVGRIGVEKFSLPIYVTTPKISIIDSKFLIDIESGGAEESCKNIIITFDKEININNNDNLGKQFMEFNSLGNIKSIKKSSSRTNSIIVEFESLIPEEKYKKKIIENKFKTGAVLNNENKIEKIDNGQEDGFTINGEILRNNNNVNKYKIWANNNLLIDVSGQSILDTSMIILWTDKTTGSTANQEWYLKNIKDDYTHSINWNDGSNSYYLQEDGLNNSIIQRSQALNSNNQRWIIERLRNNSGNIYYCTIEASNYNDQYLSVDAKTINQRIKLKDRLLNDNNQEWNIEKIN